ncbi:MAG: cation transporter [Candidatus ainarchaeum sp.]|nr:cation transporter [Candidatus ainarchaeum sp.]
MEIRLNVKSMTCRSCEKKIKTSLEEIKGVKKVTASFVKQEVLINFDSKKTSEKELILIMKKAGYPLNGKKSSSLKQGLVYGLVPHIGCIGFIIASILGVTIAVEFFKPLLMNPWFFHILILISFAFATISSIIYLKKNGVLSWSGISRKKKYLATMYGATIGINLILFLFIFPMLANLDTGSFSENSSSVLLAVGNDKLNTIRLQVEIPCPGHASLITNEIKTINGVTGVKFEFPNYFDVAYTDDLKNEILALDVFNTYPVTLISEDKFVSLKESNGSFSETSSLTKVTKSNISESSSQGSCSSCSGGSTCSSSPSEPIGPSCEGGSK